MKTYDRPAPGSKTCPVCGNPVFRQVMLRAKYCSRECRQKVAMARFHERHGLLAALAEPRPCKLCGAIINRKVVLKAEYCSSRCRFKFNKAKLLMNEIGPGIDEIPRPIRRTLSRTAPCDPGNIPIEVCKVNSKARETVRLNPRETQEPNNSGQR